MTNHFDSKISRVSPHLSTYSDDISKMPVPVMSKYPKSQMPATQASDLTQMVQVLNFKQVSSKYSVTEINYFAIGITDPKENSRRGSATHQ